ncbi:MAG: ATP-binding protein [Brevinematia bacterium]
MSKLEQSETGKLKIGDDWNAITIIALSQNNPLKAIAEFVENSIDARASNITIIKGRQHGEPFLKVVDDGSGIDDFNYVATHIGDSIKRQLKKSGVKGIQGEFGIGLLSFWTVGEELIITSTGKEGICRRMKLIKNNPGYSITEAKTLFPHTGTELLIKPLLPGIRQLSGEKIQNYLASELRDRISKSGVKIKILDHIARKEYNVEPRKFKGVLLHNLPEVKSPLGDIYYELYLNEPSSENKVGLYRCGTRVLPSITEIEQFNCFPWTSGYLEGMIDVSFLQLTPGTRGGIIYDEAFESFCYAIKGLEIALSQRIEEQKIAEEEKVSRNILQKITKALREALSFLPEKEYDWLNVRNLKKTEIVKREREFEEEIEPVYVVREIEVSDEEKKWEDTFNLPEEMTSVSIQPGSAVIGVGETKKLKAVARDKKDKILETDFDVFWRIAEGGGELSVQTGIFTEYKAPQEPGITKIEAEFQQNEKRLKAECIITVTKELFNEGDRKSPSGEKKGLPGYTFQHAPGELWRSRYDPYNYIIIINNGHADFIYASKNPFRKLKYIARLFAKELVLENFPGADKSQLLERMIELELYMEENLR